MSSVFARRFANNVLLRNPSTISSPFCRAAQQVDLINPNLPSFTDYNTFSRSKTPLLANLTNSDSNLSIPRFTSPLLSFEIDPRNCNNLSLIRSYSRSCTLFNPRTLSYEKHINPNPNSIGRPLSTSPEKSDSENPSQPPEFKHQEIEGPTVERDLSALAEETRQVLESLQRSVYNLSKYAALLGLAQLGCGAWIAYTTQSPAISEVSIQSFAAFGFPFSLAFLLRRTVMPMRFYRKMEQQGRLQILTLSLQISKCLNLFFLRVRVISVFCVVGISVGMFAAIWSSVARSIV